MHSPSLGADPQPLKEPLIDIPEDREVGSPEESSSSSGAKQSLSEEELEERNTEEAKFYERLLNITRTDDVKSVDSADFQFLTDFSIVNVTLTVYRELQANTFFSRTDRVPGQDGSQGEDYEAEKEERERELLEGFKTRGRFRLCQLYPLIVRSVIGYYSTIASNYYEDTIKQRRHNQVPIGLNDKAYAIVCNSVKKLVEMEMARSLASDPAEEGDWRTIESSS